MAATLRRLPALAGLAFLAGVGAEVAGYRLAIRPWPLALRAGTKPL